MRAFSTLDRAASCAIVGEQKENQSAIPNLPMAEHQDKPVFTYQTRLPVAPEQDQWLRQYASLFGHIERTLFADMQKGKDANQLKSEYLRRFAITARQFNAVRIQLQGKIAALEERIPLLIENQKRRIRKAKKVLAKLVKNQPGGQPVHEKRRRLAHLEWRLEQLEAERKVGRRVRLCFGSKKLFRAQFYLAANGYQSHAEWYADWTEARSRQFFVLGSKDETAGCQGCVAIPEEEGTYALRLRLPYGVGPKYVRLTGIRFAYGQEEWKETLACGRALSYRFLHDDKGWRVFVSAEASPVKPVTDRRWGAIGVDINQDQLVLAEIDRWGNFVGGKHINCITYGKSQDQVKAMLGEIAKQVMAVAEGCGKPLVLERLEFEKKKATLEGEGSRRARRLSAFAYHQTKQRLKAAAFRAGVEVIQVTPAYSSTIGAVNYAHRYGISVHQGAAIAIARRSLHLSERPAKRVAQVPTRGGDHVTLLLPERNRSKHVWSLWSKVSRQMRAALAAHLRLLRRTARSTPAAWSYQPPCAT